MFSGDARADVVVIGAGMAGVMTAWRLAQAGTSVVLLEKNHLATGDTGFTTAFVTRVPDAMLHDIVARHGQEFLQRLFRATREAQDELRRLVKHESIACDWVDCASYDCTYQKHDLVHRQEWEAAKNAEPGVRLLSGDDARAVGESIVSAIRFEGEAFFDVRKFIFGLLERSGARKIKIFEESAALEVSVTQAGVTVVTKHGSVVAQRAVVTTGFPRPSFPEFRTLLTQKTTFALAARFAGQPPFSSDLFWDTQRPYNYYRHRDANSIIIGGADHELGAVRGAKGKEHDALLAFLQRHFPRPYTVTNAWSGSLFETADGLPYIAEHPRYPRKLYVATGFNGNGMVIGALAGMILADLATGRTNVHAKLFDFSRTGATIGAMETATPVNVPVQHEPAARSGLWRWMATLVYVSVLVLPGYVFFSQRGGLSFLQGLDFKTFNLAIFPLVGLYAFTLLWSQFVIGAARSVLRTVVHPKIITFHRRQGVLIFLLAWLHPTLRFFGIGLDQYFKSWNVAPSLVPYLWLGYVQLFLLMLTAGTALLRKLPWLKTRWHTIHYLNYGVFVLVWIHSWFLGSDVRSTNLRYLWWFFAVTALAATAVRIRQAMLKRKTQNGEARSERSRAEHGAQFVPIATIDQFKDRSMVCATVNGKPLALFKVGEQYFCLDNTCSHAGGPLCEGVLEGTVVECPLHASRFDVTTGAVAAGPAHEPQRTYTVRLNGSQIEVAV